MIFFDTEKLNNIEILLFFFFKQKTAYEITYGDWSSDVCSSDLRRSDERQRDAVGPPEPVLRRVLAAAGPPREVHDVVLLHHLARRAIGAPVQDKPPVAG